MTLGNNQLRIVSQCEISRPMTHKFINHDEYDKLRCPRARMKEWLAAFRDLDMALRLCAVAVAWPQTANLCGRKIAVSASVC